MSALRIAITNQKGGTGKTTLALNLAAGLHQRDSTIILDTDPQKSISQWAHINESGDLPEVQHVRDNADLAQLLNEANKHRYVVLDCPPTLQTRTVGDVLRNVDIALIPIQPSPVDLWASIDIADEVNRSRKQNPRLKAFVILNQLDARNTLSKSMHEALEEFDFPTLRTGLARRAAYRNAAMEGTSVYGLGPRGKTAVCEIEAIIKELLK
jgi:chromosome partitioning protein